VVRWPSPDAHSKRHWRDQHERAIPESRLGLHGNDTSKIRRVGDVGDAATIAKLAMKL
jgi:hypothetical protein